MRNDLRIIEKLMAVAALVVAAALAFTSLLISEEHDITANVLFVIAQFLLFAASILGIDYHFDNKLGIYNLSTHAKRNNPITGNTQQEPS